MVPVPTDVRWVGADGREHRASACCDRSVSVSGRVHRARFGIVDETYVLDASGNPSPALIAASMSVHATKRRLILTWTTVSLIKGGTRTRCSLTLSTRGLAGAR